jgi:hypothetical protein
MGYINRADETPLPPDDKPLQHDVTPIKLDETEEIEQDLDEDLAEEVPEMKIRKVRIETPVTQAEYDEAIRSSALKCSRPVKLTWKNVNFRVNVKDPNDKRKFFHK